MDIFIDKYRWIILVGLSFIIIAGIGIIWYDKAHREKINNENQTITELQVQNDQLRAELSNQAPKLVAGEESVGSRININTADLTELDKLPGIGPARAADIISYREENGSFSSIEELKNISGIGDKIFENLKDLVTIGESLEN